MAAVALTVTTGLAVTAAPAAGAVEYTPGAPGAGDPYFPDMGNGGYDVGHYDIKLSYDPATKAIRAVTDIQARATQHLSRFNLDFLGPLRISSLKVNGAKAAYRRTGAQELEITPPRGLPKNTAFTVSVAYSGVPQTIDDDTLGTSGWVPNDDGAVMVNQPFGAATVFPVNDTPKDKATYRFALTAPSALTSLANGDFEGKATSGGLTTSRWAMNQPMASELSMLAIGRYDVLSGKTSTGIPNITATDQAMGITPERARFFHDRTAEVQDFLASRFGKYPFTSTGGIVVKGGFEYALETQGRSVYDLSTRQPGSVPSDPLLAHELAHQWWGDSSTPARWSDIWLNEGFATYAEWMFAEATGGATAQETFDDLYATPADDDLWVPKTADPGRDNIFHPTVYDRGAMTVHVLRKAIGEEDFARLIQAWPTRNRGKNFTTQEFIRFAEDVSGERLDDLFQKWVFTSGKPAL
jgi:aminopeptidase N